METCSITFPAESNAGGIVQPAHWRAHPRQGERKSTTTKQALQKRISFQISMQYINSEIFSSVPLLQMKHVKIKIGEMILQRIHVEPPAITGSGVTRHNLSCHMETTDSINHLHSPLTVNHFHPS